MVTGERWGVKSDIDIMSLSPQQFNKMVMIHSQEGNRSVAEIQMLPATNFSCLLH
jgi:hypothetical protein